MTQNITDQTLIDALIRTGTQAVVRAIQVAKATQNKQRNSVLHIEPQLKEVMVSLMLSDFLKVGNVSTITKPFHQRLINAFNPLSNSKKADLTGEALNKILDTCRKSGNPAFLSQVVPV